MGDVLESEPELEEGGFEPECAIDEKHACFDLMALAEFREELCCQNERSDGKESDVQGFVRIRIDGSVQSVAMVVELNHGFVCSVE